MRVGREGSRERGRNSNDADDGDYADYNYDAEDNYDEVYVCLR